MEKEYQKIGNMFEFDEKTHRIVGMMQPYASLKDLIWQGTEKIDGTNIRVHWDGHSIEFGGRTDTAEIPPKLLDHLEKTFKTQEMEYIFEQVFGESEAYVFGEGFGEGINNGGNYVLGGRGCSFIVFDVQIDGWDLNRTNVNDVASKLGLPFVPVCFEGTLEQAQAFVADHPMSTLCNGAHEMEGLVLVPRDVQLYDKKRHLIKCKCKYRDLRRSGLNTK